MNHYALQQLEIAIESCRRAERAYLESDVVRERASMALGEAQKALDKRAKEATAAIPEAERVTPAVFAVPGDSERRRVLVWNGRTWALLEVQSP